MLNKLRQVSHLISIMYVCIYIYIYIYICKRWPRGDIPLPRSGAVAVLCWSSCEEISHVQCKRNPSKTVGVVRGLQGADTLKP